MVVAVDAALQSGKEFDHIVKHAFYIIVELVAPRTGVHNEYRPVESC